MDVHFSSNSDEWETPDWLFSRLDMEFDIDWDVCAADGLSKVPSCNWNGLHGRDALAIDWVAHFPGASMVFWMNPPYSEIKKWMEKAYTESLDGCTVVCLVPARTDTAWWHDYALKGQIRFIRGRLKFGGSKNSAPFPSAVVIFGKGYSGYGPVIDARGKK